MGTSRTPSTSPWVSFVFPLFLSKVGIFLPLKRDLTVQGLYAPFAREWPLIWAEEPSYTNIVCLQLSDTLCFGGSFSKCEIFIQELTRNTSPLNKKPTTILIVNVHGNANSFAD
ncbi:hypothetical protein CEXT_518361 [Caerostris extrusa]|uniref:Uncharacterized protein n=1 Tax=Caerostris extrusa TaxID=172846 RepID=A0AAV4WGZ6_CAEEX|nr:hypothetical protein CEXT_518361 [Caerostris extrusa]